MKSLLNFDPPLDTAPATESITALNARWTKEDPELIIQPAFQRNSVWSWKQQSLLIDSILRGAPVPEIYRQTKTDDDGREVFIIVDGQQRITACLQFIANEYALPESEEYDDAWKGAYFSDLSTDLRRRFRTFRFIVRDIPERVTEDELREIFRRLNTTVVSLNEAELRNAAYSNGFTALIQLISESPVLTGISLFSANDYRRKKNEEFTAEIFDVLQAAGFPNKKDGLSALYRSMATLASEQKLDDHLTDPAKRFGRTLKFIAPVSDELRKTRFRNKSDFYSLFTFLSMRAELLSTDKDARASHEMMTVLKKFSASVNATRKRPDSSPRVTGDLTPEEQAVESYTKNVERAASDRLNRIRRNEALEQLLAGALLDHPQSLNDSDDIRNWPAVVTEEGEEVRGIPPEL